MKLSSLKFPETNLFTERLEDDKIRFLLDESQMGTAEITKTIKKKVVDKLIES